MRTLTTAGAALTMAFLATPSATGDREAAVEPVGIDTAVLETGDLIFRRGRSLLSRVVLAGDTQSGYSHVGLLSLDGSEAVVIHVLPPENAASNDPAPVRTDPLASFIDPKHAAAWSVWRLKRSGQGARAASAAAAARRYVRQGVSFDARFDLETTDRLYCTELVWRAYQEAGIDLVAGVFARLDTPFGKQDVLPPSLLLGSPHLREIAFFESKQ